MPRKVLLGSLCGALFIAGCATVREESRPAPPAPQVSTGADATKPKAAPTPTMKRPAPRTVARPKTSTPSISAEGYDRTELPAMIGQGATWNPYGFASLSVKKGGPTQLVPIFRQAGTLAAVRAALADSPAQPQAEFRNGVLTLKFDRGSNAEIASAVNKTLSVAGTRNLQVTLPP